MSLQSSLVKIQARVPRRDGEADGALARQRPASRPTVLPRQGRLDRFGPARGLRTSRPAPSALASPSDQCPSHAQSLPGPGGRQVCGFRDGGVSRVASAVRHDPSLPYGSASRQPRRVPRLPARPVCLGRGRDASIARLDRPRCTVGSHDLLISGAGPRPIPAARPVYGSLGIQGFCACSSRWIPSCMASRPAGSLPATSPCIRPL